MTMSNKPDVPQGLKHEINNDWLGLYCVKNESNKGILLITLKSK